METARAPYGAGNINHLKAEQAPPPPNQPLVQECLMSSSEAIGRLASSVATAREHADRILGPQPTAAGGIGKEAPVSSPASQLVLQLRTIHELISSLNHELDRLHAL